MSQPHRDLAQSTLGVFFIAGMVAALLWILRPFAFALFWASTVVIATWPVMLDIQRRLGNRRWSAVAVMTLMLILLLFLPLLLAITTMIENKEVIAQGIQWLMAARIPEVPEWVQQLPLVGRKLHHLWSQHATSGLRELAGSLEPYGNQLARWVLSELGSFGMQFVHLGLTVILSSLMYANGEHYASWLQRFGHRLAGQQGESAVRLAGQSIRGVAMGVVITALAQSLAGGITLAIASVPFAAVLTILMFLLCIAQLGPLPVLWLAAGWLFWQGESPWGITLLVASLIIGTMDNFIRPCLIKKGADLPLILIFAGVVGGLLTIGLAGIFVGPVLLAVVYTLANDWIAPSR